MTRRRTWSEVKGLRPQEVEGSPEYDRACQSIAFGRQVWLRRQERGQSRMALAREAGISATMIERVELGDPDVSPFLLTKLAAALSLDFPREEMERTHKTVSNAIDVSTIDKAHSGT